MTHRTGIILAADLSEFGDRERSLFAALSPYIDVFKVGLQAMTSETYDEPHSGASVATLIRAYVADELKRPIMWDMKLNDIENTMSATLRNIVGWHGVKFTTIHATSSDKAQQQASMICRDTATLPLVVTVLTDLSSDECISRFSHSPNEAVLHFLNRAKSWGITGLVCSPRELIYLNQQDALRGITTVIPGVRSEGMSHGDQARVMTPTEAAELGADYIVVGREIMHAENPVTTAIRIRQRLDSIATKKRE